MTDEHVSEDELADEIEAEICSRIWDRDDQKLFFKSSNLAEDLGMPVNRFNAGLRSLRKREDARLEIVRWNGETCSSPWEATLTKRVAADGGNDVPGPVDWAYPAVVHGADVDADCLALTNAGDPCTYNAYDSNDLPVCNTHADVDDPNVVEDGHQWARIKDGTDYVTVCVNCQDVWSGREPETSVDCPTCQADAGERCKRETSGAGISAPIPPHPDRRKVAYDCVPELEPCDANPAVDEEQQLLTDGGHAPGGAAVPPGANVDEAPWDWQVRSRTARNLYDDAMREWGEEAQIAKASEECSELAAVLSRDLNGQANVAELLQEIADVRIMLEQLAWTIGLGQDDLEAEVTTRLQQLDVRLRGGEDGD